MRALHLMKAALAWEGLDEETREETRSAIEARHPSDLEVLDAIISSPKTQRDTLVNILLDVYGNIIQRVAETDDEVFRELVTHGRQLLQAKYGVDPARILLPDSA